jgi:transcriptional regulator with XRE-family HTH domain
MNLHSKDFGPQPIDDDYEDFLRALGKRIKQLRNERGWSLRDMVVHHGYHDSQWRRMERGGAGNVQSLLKIARAFQISLSTLLDGLGEYPVTAAKDLKHHVRKSIKTGPKTAKKKAGPSSKGG